MIKDVFLYRIEKTQYYTLGIIIIDSNYICFSCEPPDKNNIQNKSCIPEGTYSVILEYSNKFNKKLYEVKNVTNRDEIKFHPLSYSTQTQGCIGLMLNFRKENTKLVIYNSSDALKLFTDAINSDSFVLKIRQLNL